MFRRLTPLLALLACACWVHAQEAVEDFNYPAGTDLATAGAAGNGWAGGWTFVKGGMDGDAVIAAGGLTADGIARTTDGNHLAIAHDGAGGTRYWRQLATPYTDVAGTQAWFSMFMATEIPNDPAMNGSVHFMGYANSAAFGGGGPGGQIGFIGRQFAEENFAFVRIPTNAVVDADQSAQQLTSVVSAIYFNGPGQPEGVFVWFDPDPDATTLDTAAADIKRYDLSFDNGFDAIGGKMEGGGMLAGLVDEVRVGGDYISVVSPNLVASAMAVEESFDYPTGDSLAGKAGGSGWAGPWESINFTGSATVEAGGVASDALLKATSQHVAVVNRQLRRELPADYGDDGRDYWLGFWSVTDGSVGGTVSRFVLGSSQLGTGGGAAELVQIGRAFGQDNLQIPGIGAAAGVVATEGHFYAVKVVTNGTADPDSVYVWVDPALDATPSASSAALAGVRSLTDWRYVGLKVAGGAGVTTRYDDVEAGLTFAEIVPDDLIDLPPPPSTDAIAFDKFDYTPGTPLVGSGGNDNGWAGPWTQISDTIDAMVSPRALAIDELLLIAEGPSAMMRTTGENGRVQRLFETPIDPADGDFWFASQIAAVGNFNTVATINLIDTTQASQRDQQALFVGKRFGSGELFAAGFGGSGAVNAGNQLEGGVSDWIVSKVVRNADSARWELFVWVNPDPMAADLDTATAAIKGKPYATERFHGIWLKTEANLGLTAWYDNLFVGRTYDDVKSDGLMPIPAGGQGVAEGFDYAPDQPLDGLAGGDGWAGAWEVLEATGSATTAAGGVTSLPLLKQTDDGHAVVNLTEARRELDAEYGDFGRTYWLGYWTVSEGDFGGNVSRLVLGGASYDGSGSGELVQIGKGFGADNIGFAGGPAAPGVLASEGHFVVAEVVSNGPGAQDQVYLWVDPALVGRPSRDSATVHNANLDGWRYIGLKLAGNDGVTTRFDDIRTGTSYAQVVPDDLTDVQAPGVPVAAVDVYDYALGADLAGLDGGAGWGGPYMLMSGTATGTITDGLDSDRVDEEGNAVAIASMGTDGTFARPFFATFGEDGADSASVWVSFLHQQPVKRVGSFATVDLRTPGGTPVVRIGTQQGNTNQLAITIGGTVTPVTADPGETVWIVARVDLDGTDNGDDVYVWANPPSDALPSEMTAIASATDIDGLDDGLASVGYTVGGGPDITMVVDEFRIGFSYRDISTQFGSSDPNLIAYEPFNYDAGVSLPGQGGVNAFWDGTWENVGGPLGTNEATVLAGSVDIPGAISAGNRVEVQLQDFGQQIRIQRPLAFPFSISDSSEYWISHFRNATAPDAFSNVGLVVLVGSGAVNYPNGGEIVGFGRVFDAAAAPLGIAIPGAGLRVSQNDAIDDGLSLVVARILSRPNSATDLVALWVNPDVTTTPDTATADVILQTARFRDAEVSAVRLKVEAAGGMPPYIVDLDEVRIARNFQTSVGVSNASEPHADDPLALTAFPNPASAELTVGFASEGDAPASVRILDARGRVVAVLERGLRGAGAQQRTYAVPSDLPNGFYYVQLRQGERASARKLIIYR